MEMTTMKIRTIINDMIAETNTLINTYDELAIKRYWIRYKYELQKAIEMLDDLTDAFVDDYKEGYEWSVLDVLRKLIVDYLENRATAFPYKAEMIHITEIRFAIKALEDLLFRIDVNRDICDIG